ncbi:hypothetical protein KFL_001420210 [Klebsormidium nitens]|uniref:Integrase catalytic domain-containing protein n=1 Tax=Klebsormidium nitens TaxID=105231 RepID=A0A1Y1I3I4_KLENI|nr:hypothetical protein KFL_001420210 [Klebsormidium nitens]|eukprot:GAQ83296.1 hypothetical protein KFL_001420210 [Klebsormidium nitens]
MLSEFDFEVKHKPGVDNEMDYLSRFPQQSSADWAGVRQEGDLEEAGALAWSAAACLSWQPGEQPEGEQGLGPGTGVQPPVDVWEDQGLLAVLRGEGLPAGCSPREWDRLHHRARGYEWRQDHLVRRLASGEARVVPRPAVRAQLVRDLHERAGHMGVRKTVSLLRPHYWWVGLSAEVEHAVRGCEACDRVRATFNAKHPALHPLPIRGLFYWWGLDFAGPLPKSVRGNQYVLVLVEHFSKTVVLAPTVDKEPASTVAAVFTREVLTRYGACAKAVTDRGGEFGGEFQACLDAALIDHRATSAYHPQANGLSERIVQVVKRALRKWCLGHPAEEWHLYLPWIAMGYNFSAQHSLAGFSPYQLLHGREPVVPGAIKVRVEESLDLDDEARLVALVEERAALFKKWVPMAMGNLEIAQHRDTLRYAKTRSGAWKPQVVRYEVGDYVYLQREMVDTLDTRAGARILRVRSVGGNGVLELEGADARTVRVHVERCAPCHRADVDGRVDPSAWVDERWRIASQTGSKVCPCCGHGLRRGWVVRLACP